MRISSLSIKNFRTVEFLELDLHKTYSAICGPNDSGKTNIVRAIRALLNEGAGNGLFDAPRLSFKDDFPKWIDREEPGRAVEVSAKVVIDKVYDAGLFQSILKQLSIDDQESSLELTVRVCPTRVFCV